MEKEYLNALLGDIEKSVIPEEKISLLTILIKDLVQEDIEKTKTIESIKQALELSSLAHNALLKNNQLLARSLEELSKSVAISAGHVTRFMDSVSQISDAVPRNINDITNLYEMVMQIYEHIDKVEARLTRTLK
ncbi:hypothetical protein TH53_21790 [Pedobacter lusitanus]|uniref:Uncharacterized protein n=1 Tax=Pedobacter lusitanus TaxID=1503925 RepID=A0A0D0GLF6_9SPHI|nr:hypothetical protein [Pedobacter lusitanus]KIO75246.1 hypothetical protein TH53_21790 [Pedobacter lusitanus]